jgi:hypothetical protein
MATQWEYRVIEVRDLYGARHELEIDLDKAGSDGWEAVATLGDAVICFVVLKRQKSK